MSITQNDIEHMLTSLQTLLDELSILRKQAKDITTNLNSVQHDYEEKLGTLDSKVAHIEGRIQQITALLAKCKTSIAPSPLVMEAQAPPPVIAGKNVPMPLPESPSMRQKRALADHIFLFVSSNQEQVVMRDINVLLVDQQRTVGDMLEMLEWGAIWTSRAAWESPVDQYHRLESWHTALQDRVVYWYAMLHSLKNDWRDRFWQKRSSLSNEEWQALLNDLAHQQMQHLQHLHQKVATLEQAWQKRQAEEGQPYV